MGHKFADIAFTDSVKAIQEDKGSRGHYKALEAGEDFNHELAKREMEFIEARDSFYMASVSESGWPYVQHRGGPQGFLRIIDKQTIGFADFAGNRQYVSVGNVQKDNRVSLILVDYPSRTRLKILGRVELVDTDNTETLSKLELNDYRARVERGFVIHIEAFDWNCPQHIKPRYTQEQVDALFKEKYATLIAENEALKERIEQ